MLYAIAKPKPKRKPNIRSLAMSLYDYMEQALEDPSMQEWVDWRKDEIKRYYGEDVLAEAIAEARRISPWEFAEACA